MIKSFAHTYEGELLLLMLNLSSHRKKELNGNKDEMILKKESRRDGLVAWLLRRLNAGNS